MHQKTFEIVCNLGAALHTKGVKATDVAVTELQRLILEGQLADDRALDAAVTILEDVVSNVIPGIVSVAEDQFGS